jgi:hypothetical protein
MLRFWSGSCCDGISLKEIETWSLEICTAYDRFVVSGSIRHLIWGKDHDEGKILLQSQFILLQW